MKKLLLTSLLIPWHVWAQLSVQQLLPPSAKVQEVLLATPHIQGARHRQQAQVARAQQQAIGSHEFTLRINQQSRHVQDPSQTFGETLLTLERPLRVWTKGRTDLQLAEQSRAIAQVGYADALHESSRRLLAQWLQAWRTKVVLDSAQEQWRLTLTLERQAIVRLQRGDISKLDAELARAESQRVGVQRDMANNEWLRAQAMLTRLYPGLGTPGALPELNELPALAPLDVLREAFLNKHHELNLIRAESARATLLAHRQQQERLPDPTVGIFTARERMGAERVMGVSLGVPLPGSSRQYLATAVQADASAWEDRVRQAELEFGAEFERRWLNVRDLRQSLQQMATATRIQQQAASQAVRAYALGESTMTDVLQHQRWADDQLKTLRLMELELLEQIAFIELDLHQLWDLD